ncbi:MAG: ParA family protein, partial [Clostridiales bacterium]|nr:ParA family protein [Clostridiales bacterium]
MNDMDFQSVVDRQEVIANGEFPDLGLPKHDRYAICNLRGGIGKTTLSFNLCFLADDVLAVDTCPQ